MHSIRRMTRVALVVCNPLVLEVLGRQGGTIGIFQIIDEGRHHVTGGAGPYRFRLFQDRAGRAQENERREDEETHKEHPMIRASRKPLPEKKLDQNENEDGNQGRGDSYVSHQRLGGQPSLGTLCP